MTSTTCSPSSSAISNLLKRRAERGDKDFLHFADSALDGAERAATLTQRLLAFSRQQPLAPQPVDCNKLVAGMSELLRRTLGEAIHVETVLAGGLWRTFVDPSQLEAAIVNLAVNGRDAMPEGGKLTIETANASLDEAYASQNVGVAGRSICAGLGDRHGRRHVARSGGQGVRAVLHDQGRRQGHRPWPQPGVRLRQAVGRPCQNLFGAGRGDDDQALSAALLRRRRRGRSARALRRRSRFRRAASNTLVLVVEDEPRMRRLAVEAFRDLGYGVLHADGPEHGARHHRRTPRHRLLFTDVVMPGMSGRQLAEEAQRRRPALKVIYTTGFSRNAVIHNGVPDRGVNLLSKPFTVAQLARKAHAVLKSPK